MLWRRVSADSNRPLLKTIDPRATLQPWWRSALRFMPRRACHIDTSDIDRRTVQRKALEAAN